MPSCEMFSRLDMELERERENELSSLSTRPVGNIHTHGLLRPPDTAVRRRRGTALLYATTLRTTTPALSKCCRATASALHDTHDTLCRYSAHCHYEAT